ncbi:MAG TPA: glycosyltransferase family 39 protein [Salinivirga sp.]|uniref:glycosyltransferase family 39 protein n=1 Tax=Salinivirga sp. TaxID=1970192 RepID=UPI002B46DB13|nr:glycosyltransferase family 39 protein [Salinivirga sp.]HKK58825.1 glycosyltransferase family 39 protein [Salinivirga sp.]
MRSFTSIWSRKPLRVIILIALAFRLLAVIFSQGYAVHDDHFMVIETAQAWIDGTTYQNWLPSHDDEFTTGPIGNSFTYVGLHYLLFSGFEAIGIMNANSKMLIIRLLHALFSLLVVNYAYRITHLVSNKDMARYVGLLIATFWILPFVSVHNLAEFFAVPFLMLAIWFMLRPQYRDKPLKWAFLSGLVLGIAFSIWFFIFIFIGGYFIVLATRKRWRVMLVAFLGLMISAGILQGVVDYYIWQQPFAEFTTFLSKLEIPFTKPNRTIFSMYVVMLLVVMIPPISVFWLMGWFRSAKLNLMLFLPAFLMFLYFSFSIQQHERNIMAVFPFIVIAGVIGWNQILQKSVFWNNHPGLYRSMVIFFWVINFAMILPVSTMYSKRSPVESMLFLQKHKNEISDILIEDSNRESVKSMPLFYMEKWINMYKLPDYKEYAEDIELEQRSNYEFVLSTPRYFMNDTAKIPDYVLFVGQKRLDERIQRLKPYIPDLIYQKTIKPGLLDQLLYKLNPKHNVNQSIYIYEVQQG